MENQKNNTNSMVKIAILSSISFILMNFEFPLLIIAPEFLKMDLSDIPALIGGFALGPIQGILIELFKVILKTIVFGTKTVYAGEVANFFYGALFVGVASFFYSKNKKKKNAIVGMLIATFISSIIMALANYFVFIPIFAKLFGLDISVFVKMGGSIFSFIDSFKKLILYSILPFNLIKGFVITFITLLIYKKISVILHK